MTLTKDDLGKFFYIIEYDNEGYIQILRCKLIDMYTANKHKLENKNNISSNLKIGVMLQFKNDLYTPDIKNIYRTLEETLKIIKYEKDIV